MSINDEVVWNHRVIKHSATYEEIVSGMPATWYSIQEVYYNEEDSSPEYHTDVLQVEGESIEDLREELELMLKSLDVEPLNEIIIESNEGCSSCGDNPDYTINVNERDQQWYIDQYNRNRSPEEQVSTIEEFNEAIHSDKEYNKEFIYERNPDTNQVYKRESGNYDWRQEVPDNRSSINSDDAPESTSKGFTPEEVEAWKEWANTNRKI